MMFDKLDRHVFDRRHVSGLWLACVLLIWPAVTAWADTLFVDPADAQCSDATGTPFCTLGAAVASSADDDRIEMAAGTYNETVSVSRDITIRGAGAGATIVDGGGLGPVFNLSGDVHLERLTVTGGSQMIFGGGGGIRSFGNVQVTDCVVTGNAGAGGGGIKQEGGTLTLLRTEVSNNTSDESSIAGGAGIWTSDGDLEIIDSRIVDNHNVHEGSVGGGLKFNGGVALLVRTTVDGNTSLNNYGGISGGPLTLIDSTVSNNMAAGRAAGLGALGVDITLINTTVSGNQAQSNFGAGAIDRGGPGQLTLRNVTVFGNHNTGSSTGGVRVEDASLISNSILAGNTNLFGPSDCEGTLISQGYNLVQNAGCTIDGDTTGNLLGIDPSLLPLADNGGPTQTHGLANDSPALDAGNPATPGISETACPETDQRGFLRPQDGDDDSIAVCDIGAFELTGLIFEDGFESGDLSAWSTSVSLAKAGP